MRSSKIQGYLSSFWRDSHKRIGLIQFLFFIIIVYVCAILLTNIMSSLTRLDMNPSFRFLNSPSHIDIGESVLPVTNESSFLWTLAAGLINTLSITVFVIFFSTFIGIFISLCRLSSNWLIKRIAIVYIEIIRNIPLLLLLLIWYRAFFLKLPGIKDAMMFGKQTTPDGVTTLNFSLSNRGLSMAWFSPSEAFSSWLICIGISVSLLWSSASI